MQAELNHFIDTQTTQHMKLIQKKQSFMRINPSAESYEHLYQMNAWSILKQIVNNYMVELTQEEAPIIIFKQIKCLLYVMSTPKNYDERYVSAEERFEQLQIQPYMLKALKELELQAVQKGFLSAVTIVNETEIRQFTNDYLPYFIQQQRENYRASHRATNTASNQSKVLKAQKKRHKKTRAKNSNK